LVADLAYTKFPRAIPQVKARGFRFQAAGHFGLRL